MTDPSDPSNRPDLHRDLPLVAARLRMTGWEMIGGLVPSALTNVCPPGFMLFRSRVTGRSVLAVDTPSNYPNAADAVGLPGVRDKDGSSVDQAELVRGLLGLLRRDDVTVRETAEWLQRHRWSTHHMRMRHGLDAHFGTLGHPRAVRMNDVARHEVRAVRSHMSVYSEGRLETNVAGTPHTFEGLWHPDGQPWVIE